MNQQKLYTPQQTADMLLAKGLTETEFPTDRIPEGFEADLNQAMRYASVGGFRQKGFDRKLYDRFRDWQPPFNAAEMRLATMLVEAGTPVEYCCTDEEYDEIQDRVEQMQAVYEELKAPIVERNKREIEAKSKIIVPKGKEIFK